MSAAAAFFSQSYAEARDKFFAAARVARPRRRDATSIRCPAATARCWRWTSPATGRRDAQVAAGRQQRLPRRRGLLRLGRAGRAARAMRRWHAGRAATPASPCSTSTRLNPYGFSWWRRTTHENVDLNRNFRDFAAPLPRQRRLRRDRRGARARRPGRPTRRPSPRSIASSPSTASARCRQAISGGQYRHPDGLFYGGRDADLEPRDAAPGAARARQRAAQRLAWIDFHTGLGPSGHGERIFACRDDAAALARARRGGATSRRSTTARRPRRC